MKYILLIVFIAFNTYIKAEYTNSELQEICKIWGVIKYKTKSTKSIDLELIQILKEELRIDDFIHISKTGIADADNGQVGSVMGMNVVLSNNITSTNANAAI